MGVSNNPVPLIVTDLAALKHKKTEEIRKAAMCIGQAGATIVASVNPYLAYRMALTPEDVALLQQANTVAKIAWEAMGLPDDSPYRVAEIKEKWHESGEERTQLHTNVPGRIHDIVLAQAAMHAGEIYRRQEELIQLVQDAATPAEVNQITWR